jgi:FkbM family methyltransferase
LAARRFGQKWGILRPLVRLYRRVAHPRYEGTFATALLKEAKPGDVIWDIGANVGFYTRKLAEAAGNLGKVVAFEPAPDTVQLLRTAVASYAQVVIEETALSDYTGTAEFSVSDQHQTNALGVTPMTGRTIRVKVARGDSFAERAFPNVIKLDVEGFELDVIRGLETTLPDPRVRSVFIEVHFLEMEKRGLHDGSAQIKSMLESAGLTVRWLDPSHIIALRA